MWLLLMTAGNMARQRTLLVPSCNPERLERGWKDELHVLKIFIVHLRWLLFSPPTHFHPWPEKKSIKSGAITCQYLRSYCRHDLCDLSSPKYQPRTRHGIWRQTISMVVFLPEGFVIIHRFDSLSITSLEHQFVCACLWNSHTANLSFRREA